MRFYLGTHEPAWLARVPVPFMVSRNRLARLRSRPPRSLVGWVLDSGGFTELRDHGAWRIGPKQYAAEVARWAELVGRMEWAAPQDYMCEPFMLARTGLTVNEHQARTVGNYLDLMALGCPVIPVLQGYSLADYARCVMLYERAGIDLPSLPVVGLGSVCRRQDTEVIGAIVGAMLEAGIACHGFGCKEGAVRRYGSLLASADSLAWSLGGRKRGPCTHLASRCANHLHWALEWRESVLGAPVGSVVQLALAL